MYVLHYNTVLVPFGKLKFRSTENDDAVWATTQKKLINYVICALIGYYTDNTFVFRCLEETKL